MNMYNYNIKNVTGSIIITLGLLVVLFISFTKKAYNLSKEQPKIVSVDIREILNTFIHITQSKNATSDQINHEVDEFSNKLSKFIKDKAVQDNVIIINHQAVLAGAEDYTLRIKQELFKDAR